MPIYPIDDIKTSCCQEAFMSRICRDKEGVPLQIRRTRQDTKWLFSRNGRCAVFCMIFLVQGFQNRQLRRRQDGAELCPCLRSVDIKVCLDSSNLGGLRTNCRFVNSIGMY